MPNAEDIENFEPFDIYVGPLGLYSIDKDFESEEDLIKNGWKKIKVGICVERSIVYDKKEAKESNMQ